MLFQYIILIHTYTLYCFLSIDNIFIEIFFPRNNQLKRLCENQFSDLVRGHSFFQHFQRIDTPNINRIVHLKITFNYKTVYGIWIRNGTIVTK